MELKWGRQQGGPTGIPATSPSTPDTHCLVSISGFISPTSPVHTNGVFMYRLVARQHIPHKMFLIYNLSNFVTYKQQTIMSNAFAGHNTMELGPWAASCAYNRESPKIVCNPQFQYRLHKIFIAGECILLRMYQISKYKQPSFATLLQRALLYTYVTTCFG
jgi:hypothetical protein